MPDRDATRQRQTDETTVRVRLDLDGGDVTVDTTDDFVDHMLETLASYAGLGLEVEASGDLRHHVVEDVGICLGRTLREAIGDTPVQRFGDRTLPMDDALVQVAVDLVERPYYDGDLPKRMLDHLLRSLATEARFTLHVRTIRGRDDHHVTEAAYKALGLALGDALVPADEVRSTKGRVREGSG